MLSLIFVGYKDLNIHICIYDDLQIPDILLEDLKPQQQQRRISAATIRLVSMFDESIQRNEQRVMRILFLN